MYLLPSEQAKRIDEAITEFLKTDSLVIEEPCDCGAQISHNNGGNYHDIIYLQRDSGQVFVKYETTCTLTPPAEWLSCDDFKSVIQQNGDWL